jgi:hypothetical protein
MILGLALTSNIESSAERAFTTENEIIPVDFPVFYLGGKVALQRGATPPNRKAVGLTDHLAITLPA